MMWDSAHLVHGWDLEETVGHHRARMCCRHDRADRKRISMPRWLVESSPQC
jgi:hypothetical protein